ncbi:MAG: hypothetical protein IT200_07270 [Thermoleophilia bacterium]|nr:hypothetical protein [Thermoleophilia bacterium]
MTGRLVLLAAAAAGLVAAPAAPAADPTLIRADCRFRTERPAQIVLACGDGNAVLNDLVWNGWGAGTATATGTLGTNTCDPTCAGGTFVTFPATVRADRRRRCTGSSYGYTRLRVAYPGDRPPGARRSFIAPYPCPGTASLGTVTDNGVTFAFTAVRSGRDRRAGLLRIVARSGGRVVAGTTVAAGRWPALTTTGAVDRGRVARLGARAGVFAEVTDAALDQHLRFEARLRGTRLVLRRSAVG